MRHVLLSRMTVIKLKEPFNVKLKDSWNMCANKPHQATHNSDLVCFCWHFTENTDIFLDLGSCVSGHWMHSCKLKPFCDMRPQITWSRYGNAECVQTHATFSCASRTQTFKNINDWRKINRSGTFIYPSTIIISTVRVNDFNNWFLAGFIVVTSCWWDRTLHIVW